MGADFLVIVDQLFKFKGGGILTDMSASVLTETFMNQWVKFYGAPRKIICDQGTNLAGNTFGLFLERLGTQRQFGGSDRAGKHTATGTVEKAIDLLKVTMMKLYADLSEAGVPITVNELFSEACSAHNELLTFNGVTPNMGVFGRPSRDLYDLCNPSPSIGNSSPEEAAEKAVALRHHAKAAVLRTIAEHRLARAQHAHTQSTELAGKPAGTLVDLYRKPATKGIPGWRGPASLVDMSELTGTAIVVWQGRPYVVPLRHVRPHEGVGYLCLHSSSCAYFRHGKSLDLAHLTHIGSSPNEPRSIAKDCSSCDNTKVSLLTQGDPSATNSSIVHLMTLMDMTDASSFGKTTFRGKIWVEELQKFRMLPPGSTMDDEIHKTVRHVCSGLMKGLKHDGIRYGLSLIHI